MIRQSLPIGPLHWDKSAGYFDSGHGGKKTYTVDKSCPCDVNVATKENEKISKYGALRKELTNNVELRMFDHSCCCGGFGGGIK